MHSGLALIEPVEKEVVVPREALMELTELQLEAAVEELAEQRMTMMVEGEEALQAHGCSCGCLCDCVQGRFARLVPR